MWLLIGQLDMFECVCTGACFVNAVVLLINANTVFDENYSLQKFDKIANLKKQERMQLKIILILKFRISKIILVQFYTQIPLHLPK